MLLFATDYHFGFQFYRKTYADYFHYLRTGTLFVLSNNLIQYN